MRITWTSQHSGHASHVCKIDGKLAAKVAPHGSKFDWSSFRPGDFWAFDSGSAGTLEDAKHAALMSLSGHIVFAE